MVSWSQSLYLLADDDQQLTQGQASIKCGPWDVYLHLRFEGLRQNFAETMRNSWGILQDVLETRITTCKIPLYLVWGFFWGQDIPSLAAPFASCWKPAWRLLHLHAITAPPAEMLPLKVPDSTWKTPEVNPKDLIPQVKCHQRSVSYQQRNITLAKAHWTAKSLSATCLSLRSRRDCNMKRWWSFSVIRQLTSFGRSVQRCWNAVQQNKYYS